MTTTSDAAERSSDQRGGNDPPLDASLRTRCVESFLESLRTQPPRSLDEFLPEGAERLVVLVELVHAELEFHLKRGEPARVEEYLARYPELTQDADVVRELFAAEFRLRCRPWCAAAEPAVGDWPRLPGYEVLGELGRGAVGIVYRARQRGVNRLVAVKTLLAHWQSDADAVVRFHNEAQAIAALHHPNIVTVYDLGELSGAPFFSMELVEGGTLGDRLAGQPQDPRWAARLVECLARAMQQAHQRGVIHRDLKPSNVLVASGDQPKITDFGLARFLYADAPTTRTGQVVGTPAFMAPEQAAGDVRAVGPATDVHALGAILYQCLTGRPPFQAATALATLEQVRTREAVPVRHLQADVPRDLETICARCLEKSSHRRYPTAEALADDLARFLRGEAIRSRPAGPVERSARWVRRNPVVAGLVGLVAALLVLGTVISSLLALDNSRKASLANAAAIEANDQRQRAEERFRRALDAVIEIYLKLHSPSYRDRADLAPLRQTISRHAFRSFQAFIDENRTDSAGRFETGCAYLYVGQLHDLQRSREQAIEAYRKAIAVLRKLVADHPEDAGYRLELAQAWNLLGKSLRQKGAHAEASRAARQALTDYRAALEIDSDNRRCLNNLAWFLVTSEEEKLRNPSEAVRLAKRAVKLAPDKGSSWNTLGVAHLEAGDPGSAIEALERSLQRSLPGREVYNWYHLAMAHARLGNQVKARHWYKKAADWRSENRGMDDEIQHLDRQAQRLLRQGARREGAD